MQFFRNTSFQFMKYRRFFVIVSSALILVGVFAVFIRGDLNLGIDFAGGNQLTLKFKSEPEIDELRRLVTAEGVGDAIIQRYGESGSGEVLIKAPVPKEQMDEAADPAPQSEPRATAAERTRRAIVAALDRGYNQGLTPADFDLNRSGADALREELLQRDPDGLGADADAVARYGAIAETVRELRRQRGILADWSDLEGSGLDAGAIALLRESTVLGEFAILGSESVGPTIGAELRRKGIYAVVFSLLGMLAYIWFRFELRFGIGALVAVIHDIMITLGLFALTGLEFNLTTVAGFLTLVGYSVNDSVVVFDRVRENLRRTRSRTLEDTMNLSLNQTLSRTVLTSGTTLLALGCLLAFGGDVLRGFAFILTIGIVVGTYSSIYVASPFALLWENLFGKKARLQRREAKAT